MSLYPITANCNFESRDDEIGRAIHAARKALEAGLTDDAALIDAMTDLEDTLSQYAEREDMTAVQECEFHEANVFAAWTGKVQEAAEAEQISRYRD